MDDFVIINGELYHHGIKGMKWGIRRTPKQLGHRGSSKKKKPGKLQKFVSDKWKAHKQKKADEKAHDAAVKKAEELKKKKFSELTDDEIKTKINRMKLEREALQLQNDINKYNVEEAGMAKKFLAKFTNEAILPAATEAGRSVMSKYLEKVGLEKLGLNDKKVKSLKEQAEDAKNEYERELNKDNLAKLKKQQADDAKKAKEAANKKWNEEQRAKEAAKKARDEEYDRKKAEKERARAEAKAERDIEARIRAAEAKAAKRGSDYVNNTVYITDYTVSDVPSRTVSAGRARLSSPTILALPAPSSSAIALPAPEDD